MTLQALQGDPNAVDHGVMSEATTQGLHRFLAVLWPEIPTDHWLLFWATPSKRSEWVHTITDETITMLQTWADKENVYIGCGLRGQNFGPTLRGDRDAVTAIPALWLDVDYGPEHKKPNLPPTEADALRLLETMGPAPTMVVHSGRGLQAWWCFKEPWTLDTPAERDKAERLTKGWSTTLRVKAKAAGWDADQVGDLPRVMRLPGLWNRKGVPKKTKLLLVHDDARYNPDEFETYLAADLGTTTDSTPQLKWAFTLDPKAEPPANKFFLLMEIDAVFKASWMHLRPDLQDQSASSYDLSLATRAFAAAWSEQEVVNLLVAHRRNHHADPDKSLRRDYFERTLSRAIAGKDQEARREAVESLKAGKPLQLPDTDGGKPDKAELLKIVSETIGVTLTKFVRFCGGENIYQLEINGQAIDVQSVDVLDDQTRFRRMILDHTDRRIPKMKEAIWHEIVSKLFEAVENEQVPTEATRRGAFENWIESYISSGAMSEERWENDAICNNPFIRNGCTYVVAEGFRTFLWIHFHERFTSQSLTAELTRLGYAYSRITVRNKKGGSTKRSVWRVS